MGQPLDLIQLSGRRRVPVIRQAETAECGLACLAMVAAFHGYKTDLSSLRRRFAISLKGTTLQTLIDIADEFGLNVRPVRVDPELLSEIALPAVLHWDLNHFVVLTHVARDLKGQRYHIHDPARGELKISEAELSIHFTGVALEIAPSERFRKKRDMTPLRISQLWSKIFGLKTTLIQVGLLSILMQVFVVAGPFYVRVAVDTAIPAFDKAFVTALAIGFGIMAVLNFATSTLRDIIVLKLGNSLGYQLVTNLFRHMIRLPMSYFERRHTGDVISRFESTQPITEILSHGLIQAVVDGIMALSVLALMFYYSATLAAIAVTALALYVIIRMTWFRSLLLANFGTITARAAEASTMIETVRGMAAIKLSAREGDRQRLWQNKRANVVNAQIRMGRMQVWFDAANSGVMAIENVIFVYVAVNMTIDAKFTVGMILAFQAYKSQFIGASTRLVGQWVQFRLLDVHLRRIADIALTPVERTGAHSAPANKAEFRGGITIEDVHFAYGRGENKVLRGVNLTIEPGETLAIIGPSGSGKTTLLKLMLGYYLPNKGKIIIDDEQLRHFGLRLYRKQIGAVLQDDVLYTGSLAENIAFFDATIEMETVERVAQLACIHNEIMAMPMGYETLVGDMGSTLSGGQKQRVLLARALYNKPKILFLDEGTAHLDIHTEAVLNASIGTLGITRVIIAHRPETIGIADRVVELVNGEIVDVVRRNPTETVWQTATEKENIYDNLEV